MERDKAVRIVRHAAQVYEGADSLHAQDVQDMQEALEMAASALEQVQSESFVITTVHRNDLRDFQNGDETLMFPDTDDISDGDMQKIATRMGGAYVAGSFWSDLEEIAQEVLGTEDNH